MRAVVLILLLLALGCGFDASARSRCPPAVDMPPSWPDQWTALEAEAAALVNRARAEGATCRGVRLPPVRPLSVDRRLREGARRQTRYMAIRGVWDHSVGGCDASTWVDRAYRWSAFGQNLGRLQGHNSAALAVNGWLRSTQGHCETLMSRRWRSMGLAYVREGKDHFWTVDYGDR